MRVMAMVRANKDTETGVPPSQAMLAAMGKFNEELVQAGMLVAAEGLLDSSHGARVHFSGKKRTVTKGPFGATEQLIAGFWLLEVQSLEEALDWIKRAPNPTGELGEIEIRQVAGAEDFGEELTAELREQEESQRAWVAAQART